MAESDTAVCLECPKCKAVDVKEYIAGADTSTSLSSLLLSCMADVTVTLESCVRLLIMRRLQQVRTGIPGAELPPLPAEQRVGRPRIS